MQKAPVLACCLNSTYPAKCLCSPWGNIDAHKQLATSIALYVCFRMCHWRKRFPPVGLWELCSCYWIKRRTLLGLIWPDLASDTIDSLLLGGASWKGANDFTQSDSWRLQLLKRNCGFLKMQMFNWIIEQISWDHELWHVLWKSHMEINYAIVFKAQEILVPITHHHVIHQLQIQDQIQPL